jgi:error-prone DNA polymerase
MPPVDVASPTFTFARALIAGLALASTPWAHYRNVVRGLGALDAATAKAQRDGMVLSVAGCVITRQRPGTAKGFVFLSLQDEPVS